VKVVVIGAGGYLGRAVSARLEAHGHAVVRLSSQSGDFDTDTGLLLPTAKLASVDAGVYLAQSPYWHAARVRAGHLWNVNVVSALRASTRIADAGGGRFLYASTGNVYEPGFAPHAETDSLDRSSAYSLSKIHAEEGLAVVAGGLDVSVLRLFGIFGPGQQGRLFPRLCESIGAGRPVVLQPAEGDDEPLGLRLSMCHVEDAAEVIVGLLPLHGCPRLNVAAPQPTSLFMLAKQIGRNIGRAPVYQRVEEPRAADFIADTGLLRSLRLHDFPSLAERVSMSCVGGP